MPVRNARLALASLCALICLLVAGRCAQAQALVLTCSVSMSNVAFGNVDVLPGTSVPTGATLSVSCLSVTLTTGNLSLCLAIPPRAMTASGSTLAYDIFGPSPATTSWSNTTPILIPFNSLRLNQSASFPVSAAIAAGQTGVTPGSYSQSLTATATYGSSGCTGGVTGSSTVAFQATATVVKSCNVSAAALGFGSVGSLSTMVDGQSLLSLQCTRGTAYTVALDGGLSGATDPTARKMTTGSESVLYGLYQDSARTLPWGVSASATSGGTGTSTVQSIPVYGRVPPQATPSPGTYSDTVVLTVTY